MPKPRLAGPVAQIRFRILCWLLAALELATRFRDGREPALGGRRDGLKRLAVPMDIGSDCDAHYGHLHCPFTRNLLNLESGLQTALNSGSVGLSYGGDRRASCLLIENRKPQIRRVEYDLEKEVSARAKRTA